MEEEQGTPGPGVLCSPAFHLPALFTVLDDLGEDEKHGCPVADEVAVVLLVVFPLTFGNLLAFDEVDGGDDDGREAERVQHSREFHGAS